MKKEYFSLEKEKIIVYKNFSNDVKLYTFCVFVCVCVSLSHSLFPGPLVLS